MTITGVPATDRKTYDHIYGKLYRKRHYNKVLEYQKAYRKSIDGWFTLTYSHMKHSSKVRGHFYPKFTKQELREWVIEHYPKKFPFLFRRWRMLGCRREDKPSLDRIDDNKHYTPNNIRLTIWKLNKRKGERKERGVRNA